MSDANDVAERDWTDKSIKESERKKRDRILPDGVVLELMRKSDWEGECQLQCCYVTAMQ